MMRLVMNMTRVVVMASVMMTAVSCQESLEDRAAREDKEYTEKFCPTPPENNVITDSLVFDKKTRTQYYYITFVGDNDNEELINKFKPQLREGLRDQLLNNPQTQAYRDAGFNFAYICRSQSTGRILLDLKYTKEDFRR